MAKEIKHIDITNTPDVLRLAEEVVRSGVPSVLRRNNQDLVEVRPVSPTPSSNKQKHPPRKRAVDNSWLETLIGLANRDDFPDAPTDISANVNKYLYGTPSTDK